MGRESVPGMDVLQSLLERASCREYAPGPVGEGDWETMLAVAQQAPTDATGQLYSVLQVTSESLRSEIARLSGDQDHVHRAPKLLIVCLDVRRLRLLLEARGEHLGMKPLVTLLFGITDASLFAQNLVTAAAALGYGSCYIGGVQNHARQVARLLRLPVGVVPLWGLTLGRPLRVPAAKPRTPRRLVLHTNEYRDPTPGDLADTFEAMRPATRSGDWLNPIRKYFAKGGIMEQREEEWGGLLRDQGLDPCPAQR